MSNVISLSGGEFATPGHPDEKVVEVLKDLLERAESGHLTGLCYSITLHDGTSMQGYVGEISQSQLGATFQNLFSMTKELNRD